MMSINFAFTWGLIFTILSLFNTSCGSKNPFKKNEKQADVHTQQESSPNEPVIYQTDIDLQFRATWKDGPIAGTYGNTLQLEFLKNGAAIAGVEQLSVTPFMRVHGHGTSLKKQKIESSAEKPGIFVVMQMYFTMAGPWEIQLSGNSGGEKFVGKIPEVEVPE